MADSKENIILVIFYVNKFNLTKKYNVESIQTKTNSTKKSTKKKYFSIPYIFVTTFSL